MRRAFILVMLLVFVAGCSMVQVREKAIRLSESHKKNMETARVIAGNLNEEWPMVSGMIDGWFLDNAALDLPPKAMTAKSKLDQVVILKTWPPPNSPEITEEEKYRYGYTLGLHGRFGTAILEELITDILDHLPADLLDQVWKTFL